MSVDLGAHPKLAWKHDLTQWAPGCTGTDVTSRDYCEAETVAVSEKYLVVQVKPTKGVEELIGVNLQTGAFAWRHELPAGTLSTCRSDDDDLWCIAVTGSPQPPPTDADDAQSTEAAGPAQILAIDTDTGKAKGSSALGSSGLHDFLAVGSDFVLVSSQSSDASPDSQDGQAATTVPMDVRRFDAKADGAWQQTLPKGVTNAGYGAPVLEVGGVDYVGYLTDAKDQGIGFDAADGSVKKLAAGAAVAIYRGQLVTLRGQDHYAINGHALQGGAGIPIATDNAAQAPLITLPDDAANNDGVNGDSTQLHESDPPYKISRTVPGVARAFCGGRLFTETSAPITDTSDNSPDTQTATLRAIDPATGHVDWHSETQDGEFVICSGTNVAVSRSGGIAGLAISSGKKQWSVAVPAALMFGGWTKSGVLLQSYDGPSARSFAYLSR